MTMVRPADPPPTADDLDAITADVIAHARREADAAAAPPPPDNRLGLAAALAGRLLRRHEVRRERGALLWRHRPVNPVLGGGPDVAIPETGGGWAAKLGISRRTVPGAERVTPEAVRAVVKFGNYLQLGEVITDWGAVAHEIEVLAAQRP